MKIYLVTFDTYKDKVHRQFVYHCFAPNAKEAVKTAREGWRRTPHQFHIHATRSRIQDIEFLRVNSWKGYEFRGAELIGQYICLDRNNYPVT